MKAVIIGAGKIGRGLIAGICKTNGIEYCFVEKDMGLIEEFGKQPAYQLHLLGEREQTAQLQTAPIFHISQVQEIDEKLMEADLIFTAVGGRNLCQVGEFLGERLETVLPERKWNRAMNLIVLENWKYRDSDLSEEILRILSEENQQIFLDMVGVSWALTMGIAIQPELEQREQEALGIWMMDYWNIYVDKATYKGDLPKIKGIGFVDQFLQLQNQTLYTNNATGAIVSYLGYLKGYVYVADAANDEEIVKILDKAYEEIEIAMIRQMHVFPKDQKELACRAKEKYQDMHIRDRIERQAKDPVRKLQPEERLLAPARMAIESGILPEALALSIVAALYYENEEDESACYLTKLRKERGIPVVLEEICGLKKGEPLALLIEEKAKLLICQDNKLTT